MYKIEQKKYGYELTLGGFLKLDEIEKWHKDSLAALENAPESFGVLVDMRTLKPLPAECQAAVENVQKEYKIKGMVRSVVILDNPVITMQFTRLAKQSGIYQWERYIDTSTEKDWEKTGINWIENGVDPDS